MSGPVEWAALIFIGGLLIAAIVSSWRARDAVAKFQLDIELRLAALEKDMRHTKAAVKQHGDIGGEMLRDVERLKDAGPPAPQRTKR